MLANRDDGCRVRGVPATMTIASRRGQGSAARTVRMQGQERLRIASCCRFALGTSLSLSRNLLSLQRSVRRRCPFSLAPSCSGMPLLGRVPLAARFSFTRCAAQRPLRLPRTSLQRLSLHSLPSPIHRKFLSTLDKTELVASASNLPLLPPPTDR